ncbi:Asp-tRNA(Asn)/Glu-tRNA(Gln) amidotransferase subunit GatA [Rhodocytophaga rosea]|uniref:Glutamyl-tRNA(Gln) amidotransferase subunit A n=1 Tax=Rhodocytophaga rosea TaxID=2704465 RepID=A0A6C0GEA6_9BACT|nr:Asp-tRNA(Asn)/Glu-tRNA(Gln) amidotransferase subunit GatA [Rhodocytophaga rosea]QHT66315.1 Asp-tRNA(Asn)/Glu-tRNA(Gln) amidotransferase subunit GatA [Rhodocytophaga rosea]
MKTYSSLSEILADIHKGNVSCKKLVAYYLSNIQKKAHLNVFLQVYEQEALQQAEEIDYKISQGTQGRLAGMVIGLKDVLCYQDHHLQGGSKILDGFVSQFTATAVQRLLDEDAIIIGRQNCDEFAMGSSNENSAFGPVLNEVDNLRVPGGSSGGSAVGVQADLCHASLGSDTGGSVRQPAAFCGIVGLKPTYSRISRYGLIAYASSFDTIGILTKSVEDAALLLEVIAGKDDFDSTVSHREVPAYSQALSLDKKVRVAYIRDTLQSEGIQEGIRNNMIAKLDFLKNEGHIVEPIELPALDYILPTYYILTTAEASSNLSRFDGIKYGYRSPQSDTLENMYKHTRAQGFGEEVKRRIMLGTFVLSASYYDAYYTKAQKVRRIIKEKTDELLSVYDFLILPTTPTTAFKIGEHTANPLEMYLGDLFTVQANVVGIPAISIPNGTDAEGLPIGLQVMTSYFNESNLLAFSKYLMEN